EVKPLTVPGVSLLAGDPTDPVPSSPYVLSPQQSTCPVNSAAQMVPSAAASDTTPPVSPLTWTGTLLSLVDPLPSSPSTLAPQHCTLPALVSAQVAESATAICAT